MQLGLELGRFHGPLDVAWGEQVAAHHAPDVLGQLPPSAGDHPWGQRHPQTKDAPRPQGAKEHADGNGVCQVADGRADEWRGKEIQRQHGLGAQGAGKGFVHRQGETHVAADKRFRKIVAVAVDHGPQRIEIALFGHVLEAA